MFTSFRNEKTTYEIGGNIHKPYIQQKNRQKGTIEKDIMIESKYKKQCSFSLVISEI